MRIQNIPIDQIDIADENVRRDVEFGYDEHDKLLIGHLDSFDLLQPVVVRFDPRDKRYKLIIGRRRFMAMKEKGTHEIPAIITELSGVQAEAASLLENLIRKDLKPLEKASMVKKLVDADPRRTAGVSERYGIPKSTISEWLSILQLPSDLQLKLDKGEITMYEAIHIARRPKQEQALLAEAAASGKLEQEMMRLGVKRRVPKGLFTLRLVFHPGKRHDRWLWDNLSKLAQEEGQEITQYARNILKEHVERRLRR